MSEESVSGVERNDERVGVDGLLGLALWVLAARIMG